MTRIFVRNIPAQATVEDLQFLFAKVSPVSEVYVPLPTVTTWRRNFAIVTIEGDDTEGKKCVKALNGSVWKGEKLTIEVANEYYKDRIIREKEDEVDRLYSESKRAQDALIVIPPPPVTKEVISLRRNKAQELPNVISMKPSIGDKPTKPKKNTKKVIVPCGVRLIFDEDLLIHGRINYTEDSSDSETEDNTKASTKAADPVVLSEQGVGGEMAKIVNKLNSGEVKAIGGGLRKGFGTMSIPVSEPKPVVPAPKVIDFYTPSRNVVEEHDLHVPVHLLDEDEQSVEEEVCLTEADLTEEALSGYRNRALDIFDSLPIGPDGLVIPLNKKKLAKEAALALKNPASATAPIPTSSSVTVNSAIPSATPSANIVTTNAKAVAEKKVNFASDEDIFLFESDIQIEAPSKPHKQTLDIVNEMKAQQIKGSAAVPPATTPTPANASTLITTTDPVIASSSTAEAEDMQSTKDGFANMNVLKNIFYRDGGVWWGDDGTLSGAVSKGSAPLDPLFLEAEKHGIDIRTAKKMSAAASTAATGGGMFNFGLGSASDGAVDAMEVEEPAEEKQMLFSFFGGGEDTSADVPVNPFLTKSSTVAVAPSEVNSGVVDPAVALSVDAVAAEPKARVSTLVEDTPVASVAKGKGVQVGISASLLVTLAKKFSREKAVDELTTEWREGRDRLVLDYKRKRKDMKRRTAAWSNSNTAPATISEKPERNQSSAGSVAGSRGPQYMRGKRGGANKKRARKA